MNDSNLIFTPTENENEFKITFNGEVYGVFNQFDTDAYTLLKLGIKIGQAIEAQNLVEFLKTEISKRNEDG